MRRVVVWPVGELHRPVLSRVSHCGAQRGFCGAGRVEKEEEQLRSDLTWLAWEQGDKASIGRVKTAAGLPGASGERPSRHPSLVPWRTPRAVAPHLPGRAVHPELKTSMAAPTVAAEVWALSSLIHVCSRGRRGRMRRGWQVPFRDGLFVRGHAVAGCAAGDAPGGGAVGWRTAAPLPSEPTPPSLRLHPMPRVRSCRTSADTAARPRCRSVGGGISTWGFRFPLSGVFS